ncbi:MAG: cyanophycin synthetase, partial [Microgenomates group bacterium]
LYYDDYAHHPHEIKAAIEALGQWYPEKQKYIAFQPHTFSRTKSLMEDFSTCLAHVPNLLLLDVYASAREVAEGNDTIELLKRSIESKQNSIHDGIQRTVQIIGSITDLAQYFQEKTKNSVVLTLGAGDIYRVHDLLKK